LKEENVQLMERINEIDSEVNRDLQDQLFTLKNDYALLKAKNNTLQEFIDTKIKVDWKSARIDILEKDLQKCAEQRDEYKHQLNAANKENEKLKKDIVDYVFDKDEEIEKLKAQKHPMHPIHWSGCDGAASAYPEQYSKWLNEQKDKATEETKDKVRKMTPWVEEPVDWPRWKGDKAEESWKCPCNKCKEVKKGASWEEAASDLALRVVKLEKQIKELTLIKLCQKPS
jgi:hypothetical protein